MLIYVDARTIFRYIFNGTVLRGQDLSAERRARDKNDHMTEK